jgi:alpha-1,2-mannosyltransferase
MAVSRWLQITSFNNHPLHIARPLVWFGISALVGWPFSAALAVPFAVEALIVRTPLFSATKTVAPLTLLWILLRRFLIMAVATICLSAAILVPTSIVDYSFYRKWWLVPLHIISYNVFGRYGEASGPDIFGTEPWWFYLLNGLLQFNVAFVLAILCAPILVWLTLTILKRFSLQHGNGDMNWWFPIAMSPFWQPRLVDRIPCCCAK